MSRPGLSSDVKVKRTASAPYSVTRSIGSITLPLVFDIFSLFSSRTRPVRWTVRNGTSWVKWRPAIAIRATQKKRMSNPVTSTPVG
jgi:hypothetical protein